MPKWELSQIPQIMHIYWGRNKPLSFMRYMTVISFLNHNPSWKVVFYYPKQVNINKQETWNGNEQKNNVYDGEDYFERLKKLDIELVEFDFETIGFKNDLPEVFKSDILRIYLLSTTGGLWSDIDIIYCKSMNHLTINSADNKNIDFFSCLHYNYHNIGFLLAKKDSVFYKFLFPKINENFDQTNYQSIGSHMYKKYIEKYKPKNFTIDSEYVRMKNISFSSVYIREWDCIDTLYNGKFSVLDSTVGIHWFGGSSISSGYECIVTEESDYMKENKLINMFLEEYESYGSIAN